MVVHGISLPPGEYGGGHIQQFFCNKLDADLHPYFGSICSMRAARVEVGESGSNRICAVHGAGGAARDGARGDASPVAAPRRARPRRRCRPRLTLVGPELGGMQVGWFDVVWSDGARRGATTFDMCHTLCGLAAAGQQPSPWRGAPVLPLCPPIA